ncbi:hypothetical protein Lfu02_49880 [Longispora fulva]|uniref:Uncharacterized protein n=1 Tax=Longispora fulva TaxID=619741 RepID=A0A8J7KKP1_9ACTN|nr:sigma-70 family RNA polymerase sigma factor [Longispora fulva]MBG6138364.1 hypothetical protein [Longispora fulva]GIG60616.1 hypothetical protein Lfu02_49880 [Longispora fulva]
MRTCTGRKENGIGQPRTRGRAPGPVSQCVPPITPEPASQPAGATADGGGEGDGADIGDDELALVATECALTDRDRDAGRRMADAELAMRIRTHGVEGLDYQVFAAEAARYGIAVFRVWLATGHAYRLAALRNRSVTRPKRPLDPDDLISLAGLIVAEGLKYFTRSALTGGGWNPDGGASLKTYFIGACLLRFKDAHEAWKPEPPAGPDLDLLPAHLHPTCADPADEVVVARMVWDAWELHPPQTRRILLLHAAGLTHREIAEEIGHGLTEDAVEIRLRRVRHTHTHTDRKDNAGA